MLLQRAGLVKGLHLINKPTQVWTGRPCFRNESLCRLMSVTMVTQANNSPESQEQWSESQWGKSHLDPFWLRLPNHREPRRGEISRRRKSSQQPSSSPLNSTWSHHEASGPESLVNLRSLRLPNQAFMFMAKQNQNPQTKEQQQQQQKHLLLSEFYFSQWRPSGTQVAL